MLGRVDVEEKKVILNTSKMFREHLRVLHTNLEVHGAEEKELRILMISSVQDNHVADLGFDVKIGNRV